MMWDPRADGRVVQLVDGAGRSGCGGPDGLAGTGQRWQDQPIGELDLAGQPLDLAKTLDCGQAFRWRPAEGWWEGSIGAQAVRLRAAAGCLQYQILPEPAAVDAATSLLRAFFRLDVDLNTLYAEWAADPILAPTVGRHAGLRILRQDPVEVLCSYICSSANHVRRISASMAALARHYGATIAVVDGCPIQAFPTVERLAAAPGRELWQRADLGYRGALLQAAAAFVVARGANWLAELRALPYLAAKRALVAIPGVGPKVADCVCLFGLGFDQAVPVDTHVWAIARDLFGDRIPTRSLTPATYEVVVGLFGERFGPAAGWAQQYLFHDRRQARR